MRISDWSSDVCSSVRLELGERAGVGSFLYAAMLIAFVAGASRLAADLTKLGTPREWTGLSVHETATRIGVLVDWKGVVEGKSVSVRVDLGGRRFITKKTTQMKRQTQTIKYVMR